MILPRAWNKYEVALLIEAYTHITFDGWSSERTLSELSESLRALELRSGGYVDETFRNINGMHWQYGIIKQTFEKTEFPNRKPPQLFSEMVALYLNDKEKFDVILNNAHLMLENSAGENQNVTSLKTKFVEYYENLPYKRYSTSQCINCIERVSNYAQEHKISKVSFWDIASVREFNNIRTSLSANRIFKYTVPSDFRLFEKIGKFYSDFLKQLVIETPTKENDVSSNNIQDKVSYVVANVDSALPTQNLETEMPSAEIKTLDTDINQKTDANLRVDFEKTIDLAYSKPVWYSFKFGHKVIVSSWADLYVSLFRQIYLDNKSLFSKGQSFHGGKRADIGYQDGMVAPKLVIDDIYLETNVSAAGIISKIQAICNLCHINPNVISIEYAKKEQNRPSTNLPQEDIKDFSTWMLEEKGLEPITVQGYGSSLRKLDSFALSKRVISSSLFDMDLVTLRKSAEDLFEYPEFVTYNAEQHNRFSAALRAFLEYRENYSQNTFDNRSSLIDSCPEALRSIFEKNFKYGFREDSMIDQMKLEGFAEAAGIILPEGKSLKKLIENLGVQNNGKYYFVSDVLVGKIRDMFQGIFDSGVQVVYFEQLYEDKLDFFEESGITSPELLKSILEKIESRYAISRHYVSSLRIFNNEFALVEKELLRVWDEKIALSYDELYVLLPYIPQDKVKFYLSKSDLFVWNANEQFININTIQIDEDMKAEISSFVSSHCLQNGYVSINDLPIETLTSEYYNVSEGALQQAVFRKVLSEQYSLNGKLISIKGENADLATMLQRYCATKTECTFDEIAEYASSISGEQNRQLVFKVAYEQMVRIDKEHFVSDNNISFDVDVIDDAIAKFLNREYVAILDVASFAMFPLCGYAWNHYLLESYCYRFSKKYRFLMKTFNDKNVGVIVKKDLELSYNDVLVDVIVHSRMDLDIDCVADYLYNNGYIAKRRLGNMEELIMKAKILKEDK